MINFIILQNGTNKFIFMIVIFEDKDLKELIETGSNRKYKDIARDKVLITKLIRTYNVFIHSLNIKEVATNSYLHYEKLKHTYTGLSFVRPFGNQRIERLLFIEDEDKITVKLLEIDKTHYGNKK